jgi:asparagine synthase (glutamine-hydrolysing)
MARDVLLDRRSRERGLINPAAVSRLLDDHRAGTRTGGDAIWALLNLELWYRTFIDGDGTQTLPESAPSSRLKPAPTTEGTNSLVEAGFSRPGAQGQRT